MAWTLCLLQVNSGLLNFENAVEHAWPVHTLSSQLLLPLSLCLHLTARPLTETVFFYQVLLGRTNINSGDISNFLSPY